MKNYGAVPLILVMFIFIAVIPVFAAANLVSNPSFEEESGGLPAAWQFSSFAHTPGAADFKLEKGGAHSGDRFVTIVSHIKNDVRFRQDIPVKENTIYKLSCWIKTENVGTDAKGANLSIDGKFESSEDIKGTNGKWEYVEMYAKTGIKIKRMTITIGIGGYGSMNSGKASFDDVAVEELGIPDGATVAQLGAPEVQKNGTPPIDFASIGGPGNTFWALVVAALIIVISGSLFYVWLIRKTLFGPKSS